MPTTQSLTRRTAFAIAAASAIVIAPAAAAFAGAGGAPRVLADPGDCTVSSTPGDNSLSCAPGDVSPDVGAPTEEELTESNPGIASPEHH